MQQRRYQKPEDLRAVQAALMGWVAEAGQASFPHKGDIGHRLFNNNVGYDASDALWIWTDADGETQAFALLSPGLGVIELLVAPRWSKSAWHQELIQTCADEMRRLVKKYHSGADEIIVDANAGDAAMIAMVEALDFRPNNFYWTLTRHDLSPIPDAPLPAGFRFRDATVADAANLAEAHNYSFTNKWTAESYAQVFASPHMELELAAVAPDGRFAAFVNLWIDEVNRSLLFEPVGTHADFRRRGLASALICHAMRRMQAERGIVCAYVCHEPSDKNRASGALYRSLGFKQVCVTREYSKPLLD